MPAAPCTQKSKKGSEKQKQMYKKDASRTMHIKLKKGSQKQISKKHARMHKTWQNYLWFKSNNNKKLVEKVALRTQKLKKKGSLKQNKIHDLV